jgi:histidyl-tRNA synthetase
MANDPIRSVPGTEDVLPAQWGHWRLLCDASRRLFELYGYGEVRTPVLEDTRLFVKGTGETTDIVQKQMYTIPAGEDRSIALRPEGTPPVVRAYLGGNLHKQEPFQKFFYIGPMFRHERPQKGRLRQFHQIGVEVVGSASPLVDAETIILSDRIFRAVGLAGHRAFINSIGCPNCRPAYRDELCASLRERVGDLCEDCTDRFERNVLRVLDCKNEGCKTIVAQMPTMADRLCGACTEHYAALKTVLRAAGVEFEEDPLLVRGLDYYTRTVFETRHSGLGARDAICGGGRYDRLVELLGGPPMPCVGFGIGAEPTLIAMQEELGPAKDTTPQPAVYLVCFENEARSLAFELALDLRKAGVPAGMDFQDRSAKAQMRTANKQGARLCFLLGRDELDRGEVAVKDMAEGRQWSVPRERAVPEAVKLLSEG